MDVSGQQHQNPLITSTPQKETARDGGTTTTYETNLAPQKEKKRKLNLSQITPLGSVTPAAQRNGGEHVSWHHARSSNNVHGTSGLASATSNLLKERRKEKRRVGEKLRDTLTRCTVWTLSETGPEQTREIGKSAGEGTTLRDYF